MRWGSAGSAAAPTDQWHGYVDDANFYAGDPGTGPIAAIGGYASTSTWPLDICSA